MEIFYFFFLNNIRTRELLYVRYSAHPSTWRTRFLCEEWQGTHGKALKIFLPQFSLLSVLLSVTLFFLFFFYVKDQTPSVCFISPSCLPSCSHCSLSPAPSPGLVQLVSFRLKQIAPNLYFSLEHKAGGGGGGGEWKLEVFQTSALHYASIWKSHRLWNERWSVGLGMWH